MEETDLLDILKNISKKFSKGKNFWFDKDGKIISYDKSSKIAKTKFLKKAIKLDSKKFVNIFVNIDKLKIMDKKIGALELIISVERIIERNGKYGTELNKKDSIMRVSYLYDELDKFKLRDLHNIAKYVGNKKIFKPLKYYHYNDIKKYI
jgi:hypothetical protein